MKTRVALLSGKIATFVGLGFVVFGVLLTFLALALDVPWGQVTGKALLEQSLTGILLTLTGLLTGVPFIILGQIMLALVRQTELLAEIAQALERRTSE